jgi:hypothetical protein
MITLQYKADETTESPQLESPTSYQQTFLTRERRMLVAIKIEESTYAGKNHDGIVTGG